MTVYDWMNKHGWCPYPNTDGTWSWHEDHPFSYPSALPRAVWDALQDWRTRVAQGDSYDKTYASYTDAVTALGKALDATKGW